jgi:hypothetical protein
MKIRIIGAIIFCSFLSTSTPAGSNMVPASNNIIIPSAEMYTKIASLPTKDIQKLIGRKLTLKEKISLFILKQKLRHRSKESVNAGDISMILGIAGLVFLLLAFLLPYFLGASIASAIVAIVTGHRTRKKDPANKKAKIGKLLGWITLGLISLFFIIILIELSSIGSWSFG